MSRKTEQTVPQPDARAGSQPTASFFQDPLRLRTILVPLDLSEESYRALEFAGPLAQRFGATVHAAHVYEGARQFSAAGSSPVLWSEEEVKERLAARLERITGARHEKTHCHVRSGKPFQEIVATAAELRADLIVIATHGHGGLKHLALGSVTEKVLRHAHCPVLVVREATRGPIQTTQEGIVIEKILVPVDFSDCAREGARYASVFGTAVGADLLLLHVINPPDFIAAEGMIIGPEWPQLVQTAALLAEDKLDEMVNFLPLAGITAETQVEIGPPAEKIAEASARPDVDLVITATHGYSGMRHVLLGSVTEELVRRARCPVLVVPSHHRAPA